MKIKFIIILSALCLALYGCSSSNGEKKEREILVIVESRLKDSLSSAVEQYKNDLQKEGFKVLVINKFNSKSEPAEIREFIYEEYENRGNLEGAVFVGNIPALLFNNPANQGDTYWHDYLNDFYYMDLDGIWEDKDANGVFDEHKETDYSVLNWIRKKLGFSSKLTPEIWVSRIRADKLISSGSEVSLLRNYFSKNHLYRTGALPLPRQRAVIVSAGLDVLKSDWGARPQPVYSDLEMIQCRPGMGEVYKKILSSENGYEFCVLNVVSGARIHHFDFFENGMDSIQLKSQSDQKLIQEYLENTDGPGKVNSQYISGTDSKILFYQLLTSEAGRHDQQDYLAGTYIFNGTGLIAVAGTQHSGAVGSPPFYEYLASGQNFGEAWKNALCWEVERLGESVKVYWCTENSSYFNRDGTYKAVLIGDGTLYLPARQITP